MLLRVALARQLRLAGVKATVVQVKRDVEGLTGTLGSFGSERQEKAVNKKLLERKYDETATLGAYGFDPRINVVFHEDVDKEIDFDSDNLGQRKYSKYVEVTIDFSNERHATALCKLWKEGKVGIVSPVLNHYRLKSIGWVNG